jgi:uncharacterized protein YbaP (TraB family)
LRDKRDPTMIARTMRRMFAALWLAVFALAHAWADGTRVAGMPAHPALWTVHGAKGTAYLLGSIHMLPPQVEWRTREIDAALAKADTLVFEIKMDGAFQKRMQDYLQTRGFLPPDKHLRDMLPPTTRKLLDEEISDLGVEPASIDHMRPWLAAVTIEIIALKKQGYTAQSGIETELQRDKRPIIGLETLDTQIALIAPSDPKVELQSLQATLDEQKDEASRVMGPLLDAWMDGDTKRLDKLAEAGLKQYPQARKALLDDRNRAWTKELIALLKQDKTFFVTVGAAHLVGPRGVPNLLRAKGLRVDGPAR